MAVQVAVAVRNCNAAIAISAPSRRESNGQMTEMMMYEIGKSIAVTGMIWKTKNQMI
jgi:hypothetical protein